MKTYKYFALICAAVVAAASTGCSNNSANSGSTGSSVTSTNDTSHTTSEAGTEDVKQSESYKTVKVTAVDGNTITADEGGHCFRWGAWSARGRFRAGKAR